MRNSSDGIRAYSERLQPQLRLLYRAAHAITGCRRTAESVLSRGILRAYINRNDWRERMSFREGVLRAIWEEAREQLRKGMDGDWDWPGISSDIDTKRVLPQALSREAPDVQRLMVLRYGCSLSVKEIVLITGKPQEQIREQLAHCQARMERSLQGTDVIFKPFERFAAKELRSWMNRESSEPINTGYFLSTFEEDAAGARQPRRIFARLVKGFFMTAGALLLALLVWVLVVLMEM